MALTALKPEQDIVGRQITVNGNEGHLAVSTTSLIGKVYATPTNSQTFTKLLFLSQISYTMEVKVSVDGVPRVVCGVTEKTTCQEVVIALAQALGAYACSSTN